MLEPMTITLPAPITEYCPKCEYEAALSFFSYKDKCPKCDFNWDLQW